MDPVVNFGKVLVTADYDNDDTEISVSSGQGAILPNPGVSGAFNVTWWNITDYPDPSDDPNREIVRVTNRSTDDLIVTRAQEGTSATSKNTAGKVYAMVLAPTKKTIDDINTAIAGKEDAISAGTTAQYFRGDKTFQTLNQAAVAGLTILSTVTFAGLLLTGLTANRAVVTDSLKNLTSSSVSATELEYLSGVSSAIQSQLDGKVDENGSITGATKTKITYDAKGLVTAGADATTADISDSNDRRYTTEAQQTKLGYIAITQAVDLDAIETRVNQLDAAVVLKGGWDASGGLFPGSGTAQAGDSYIVTTGGTVNGIAFTVNDRLLAIVDNASTSIYANNWLKLDYTDQVLSVAGRTGAVTLGIADILDITSSAAELNILDGATLSTAELNYITGVTSSVQTQMNAKQATLVSGTNIKTINSTSLLGSGNIVISFSISIGNAISGGAANRVLYEDSSQNLAASSLFTYNGAGLVDLGSARLGEWAGGGGYAVFGHKTALASSANNYAILQSSAGGTLFNTAAGTSLNFRINNSDVLIVNDGYIGFNATPDSAVALWLSPKAANKYGLLISGLSSQSAPLFEIRNSSNATKLQMDSTYTLAVGAAVSGNGSLQVKTGATTMAKVGGTIVDYITDTTVGGAEADIYTNTTAASLLGINGDKIIACYGGNFVTVGTELTQLKVYFAGTNIWDSTGVAPTTGTTSWRVYVELIRVSATVVRYTVSLNTTGASGFVYCSDGELTGLTLSGTNILKITGTSSGVGSGSGDIVGKMGYVKWESTA